MSVTLLVVEDEPDLRDALRDMLEFEGFDVHTASNGKEALSALDQIGRGCIIVLDMMMPVMNGWEFLDVLKTQPDAPPVVVTSAAVDGSPIPGAVDVLKKPFNMTRLVQAVQRHCAMPVPVGPVVDEETRSN